MHRVLSSKDRLSRREMSTLLKGICQILVKGFKDEVFSVSTGWMEEFHVTLTRFLQTFSQTRKLLQYILGPFAQKHK